MTRKEDYLLTRFSSLEEIKDQISVNFKSSLLLTLYFKDLIERKSKIQKTGMIFSSSLLGYGEMNGFQAYPFAKVRLLTLNTG